MPVILGSSQVQVLSTVDGIASIVPSAGNVGPCDVFIAVSAGSSTVQFQMESMAAIVAAQPTKIRAATSAQVHNAPVAPRMTAPQSVPVMLFAVPQGELSDFPVPTAAASTVPVSSSESCPEARQSTASGGNNEDVASGVCEPQAELPAREVDVPPQAADTLTTSDASPKPDATKKSITKPRDGTERDTTVERTVSE